MAHPNIHDHAPAQSYVADLVRKEPGESLLENALEYLSYVQRIEERYLRQQGEVFTVRIDVVVLYLACFY